MKKLMGNTDIEDALCRLDRLTQEEARMAAAQGLKATHCVGDKVEVVDNRVRDVDDKLHVVIDGAQIGFK
jgi:hypothetical protein